MSWRALIFILLWSLLLNLILQQLSSQSLTTTGPGKSLCCLIQPGGLMLLGKSLWAATLIQGRCKTLKMRKRRLNLDLET